MENKWIESADKALQSVGIVNGKGDFPKTFSRYISGYGASIVQSGLVAASIFYEKKDSDSTNDRSLVVKSLLMILKERKVILDEVTSMALYAFNLSKVDLDKLLTNVDKALAAMKLVLRFYKKEENMTLTEPDVNFGCEIASDQELRITEREFRERYENDQENKTANVGWLYFRHYYRNLLFTPKKIISTNGEVETKRGNELELLFKKLNSYIFKSDITKFVSYNEEVIGAMQCNVKLYFKTTYPGLLIGSGISHSTGVTNDIKIGFQFDFSTGLPYIPGSSVKGVIRSMFPLLKETNKQTDDEKEYCELRCEYIRNIIKDSENEEWSNEDIVSLTKNIFECYPHDIFMDALIVGKDKTKISENNYFMGEDYITPHRSPLKNPIPIQFLKVLPEVKFCFSFCLNEQKLQNGKKLDVDFKKNLFKRILEDIGVGAKTNVGYGQLIYIEDIK